MTGQDREWTALGDRQEVNPQRLAGIEARFEETYAYAVKSETHLWGVTLMHHATDATLDALDGGAGQPLLDADTLLMRPTVGAVTEAWTATTTETLTFEARLARTLEEHAGSRTIRAQMIRDVAELALGRVAELQAEHAAELDALAQRHAGALEAQGAALEARIDRLEKSRDDWQQLCQSAQARLDERRTIRQELEQSAGADDCKVTIATDYHGWTVAGLEEVAYRLRTGGAGDDTPVDVSGSRAVAMVPAPNLVQLDASPRAKGGLADLQDQLPEPGTGRLRAADWRLVVGLMIVVLSIAVGTVIL